MNIVLTCKWFLQCDTMLVRYMLSSCVCPSAVTSHSTKIAKPGITQTMPYDRPETRYLFLKILAKF